MKIRTVGMAVAAALALLLPGFAVNAEDTPTPIYGKSLMTVQEQEQHRERIRNATSDEQRNQIRAEHRKQMQARAKERGVELPDVAAAAPGAEVRGRKLMTEEERARHREEMRGKTEEERRQAREEHHEQMKKRAQEQGVTIPDEPPRGQGKGGGGGRR